MISHCRICIVLRQIAGRVVVHYSGLMMRYEGRIGSEDLRFQSDRTGRASLVEHAERKHVFVSSVAGRATDALLGQERMVRIGSILLTLADRGECIDLYEGRRR